MVCCSDLKLGKITFSPVLGVSTYAWRETLDGLQKMLLMNAGKKKKKKKRLGI